jgi:hypothetical protein
MSNTNTNDSESVSSDCVSEAQQSWWTSDDTADFFEPAPIAAWPNRQGVRSLPHIPSLVAAYAPPMTRPQPPPEELVKSCEEATAQEGELKKKAYALQKKATEAATQLAAADGPEQKGVNRWTAGAKKVLSAAERQRLQNLLKEQEAAAAAAKKELEAHQERYALSHQLLAGMKESIAWHEKYLAEKETAEKELERLLKKAHKEIEEDMAAWRAQRAAMPRVGEEPRWIAMVRATALY